MTITNGSLELIYSDYSQGLPVANLEPDGVPALAAAVWGVTEIEPVAEHRNGTHGEWTCRSSGGIAGTLYYWEPTKDDPLSIARAMLAAQEAEGTTL